jgi:hypothetical protein
MTNLRNLVIVAKAADLSDSDVFVVHLGSTCELGDQYRQSKKRFAEEWRQMVDELPAGPLVAVVHAEGVLLIQV